MERSQFSSLAWAYGILQACDIAVTLLGLNAGVVGEANPVYRGLGLWGFLGIKTLAIPVLLYVAHTAWMLRPDMVKVGFRVASAFLLLVVLNNAVQIGLGLSWS